MTGVYCQESFSQDYQCVVYFVMCLLRLVYFTRHSMYGEWWLVLAHCLTLYRHHWTSWVGDRQRLKDIFVLRRAKLEENVDMKKNIYSCGSEATKLVCRQHSGNQQ